jgi:hypothetical protein
MTSPAASTATVIGDVVASLALSSLTPIARAATSMGIPGTPREGSVNKDQQRGVRLELSLALPLIHSPDVNRKDISSQGLLLREAYDGQIISLLCLPTLYLPCQRYQRRYINNALEVMR